MKVLIAVDGSPSSLDAVALVGRLVDPAVDSVAIYFSPLELEKKIPGRARRIVEGAVAAIFEDACQRLPNAFVKPVEAIVSSKTAAVGILEAAQGWHADLVVVGARGIGSVERLLLGSVSRAVLHGATLPVLVARAAVPADRGPKVLVCHHAASAAAVADTLGKLHWPATTEGRVIGVAESLLVGPLPAWIQKRVRDPDTAAIAQAWKAEHEQEVRQLSGTLGAFERTLPAPFRGHEPVIVEGNPGERILAAAKTLGDDLIVIGRTPTDPLTRWLLGSTSEAVIVHAHASVLIVPVEKTN